MPEKISLRKGNNKKQGQAYKNVTAFKHNKNSKTTRKINALPINGLCQRCFDIVQWRKSFRKYKPLTAPKKCVGCLQKSVKDAYHILCGPCAQKKNVCAKCQESKEIVVADAEDAEERAIQELTEMCMKADLNERQRRSYLRKLARDGPEGVAHIELAEKNDDDFDFGFSDEDEEDQSSEIDGSESIAEEESEDEENETDE